MEKNKIIRFVYLILSVMAISLFFTFIDNYSGDLSPYMIGFSAGQLFGHLIKVVFLLGLMVLVIRYFKIESLYFLMITLLVLSLVFSLVTTYSTNMDAFRFGRRTGEIFGNMIRNLLMLGLIVMTIRRFRLSANKENV